MVEGCFLLTHPLVRQRKEKFNDPSTIDDGKVDGGHEGAHGIDVDSTKIATPAIEVDDLLEGRLTTIVEVWRCQLHVAKPGDLEGAFDQIAVAGRAWRLAYPVARWQGWRKWKDRQCRP
jgi:hypothetical protein